MELSRYRVVAVNRRIVKRYGQPTGRVAHTFDLQPVRDHWDGAPTPSGGFHIYSEEEGSEALLPLGSEWQMHLERVAEKGA